jgi:hypothetical protein
MFALDQVHMGIMHLSRAAGSLFFVGRVARQKG